MTCLARSTHTHIHIYTDCGFPMIISNTHTPKASHKQIFWLFIWSCKLLFACSVVVSVVFFVFVPSSSCSVCVPFCSFLLFLVSWQFHFIAFCSILTIYWAPFVCAQPARSGGKFEVTPRELLLDWGTGAWGLACPGLADLFVQRVSFRFIFIGGGAAATGSLGQNNSLKRAIETSEIMPTNVGYLHSYVGYAPLGKGALR